MCCMWVGKTMHGMAMMTARSNPILVLVKNHVKSHVNARSLGGQYLHCTMNHFLTALTESNFFPSEIPTKMKLNICDN